MSGKPSPVRVEIEGRVLERVKQCGTCRVVHGDSGGSPVQATAMRCPLELIASLVGWLLPWVIGTRPVACHPCW